MKVRGGVLLGAALAVIAGCGGGNGGDASEPTAPTTTAPTPTVAITTMAPASATTTTVATTPEAPAGFSRDETCVFTVEPGDFLARIAVKVEDADLDGIVGENGLPEDHVLHPGDELDVCVGNDVDDITGASRAEPASAAVRRQQNRLNELFDPYRIRNLYVDGDSGPLTRQMLCAARMGLGLPASGLHMTPGGAEETALFEAESLAVPSGAPVRSERWILIDKTCQVMFVGEGEGLVEIYPTSTGEPGFETTNVRGVAAFRYDPAVDTDGWHDSASFPVDVDNPLNGNMYKPIYFNEGEAIHGATFVPPNPQSKGCARMFPDHQDELIQWLGLEERVEPTWYRSDIGVTITVQGEYRPAE